MVQKGSLVMGTNIINSGHADGGLAFLSNQRAPLSQSLQRHQQQQQQQQSIQTGGPMMCLSVEYWLEVWDYVGGANFCGFVASDGNGNEKSMFMFFDQVLAVRDLKPG